MTDNFDLMEINDLSKNANGGTEQMLRRLYSSLPRDILKEFQIIPSRVRDLKEDKYRVLWLHDLHNDPEAKNNLEDGAWHRFHRIVFVSNWQMQNFIQLYNIPWSRCIVMQNAIEPMPEKVKRDDDFVKLIYHTTPHRGLQLLLPVFDKLCETYNNLQLDVYSSFKLYGWAERDEQYKELFDFIEAHPNMTNYGSVSNEEVRTALSQADIFAYPSIWPETSCLCLMEAMSAGLNCVHPNYGALYETGAGWTTMYHWHEDLNEHAKMHYMMLDNVIKNIKNENQIGRQESQRAFVNAFYNWEAVRTKQWMAFLQSILASNEPREITEPEKSFEYRVA